MWKFSFWLGSQSIKILFPSKESYQTKCALSWKLQSLHWLRYMIILCFENMFVLIVLPVNEIPTAKFFPTKDFSWNIYRFSFDWLQILGKITKQTSKSNPHLANNDHFCFFMPRSCKLFRKILWNYVFLWLPQVLINSEVTPMFNHGHVINWLLQVAR